MINKTYYSLYPHCFLVHGDEKSIVFDSQHKSITFINHETEDLILSFDKYTIKDQLDCYRNSLDNYNSVIVFLKSKHLITERPEDVSFAQIPANYYSPEVATHIVCEVSDKYNIYLIPKIVNELLAKYLELRFVNVFQTGFLYILDELDLTTIKSIQIISDVCNFEVIEDFLNKHNIKKVIRTIYINAKRQDSYYSCNHLVIFRREPYEKILKANNDYKNNLSFDLSHFLEAHNNNTYYNKRVCIDSFGHIKNCLKYSRYFGIVDDDDILSVVHSESFQKLWKASPDTILELKNDPLRYNMFITHKLICISDTLYRFDMTY